MNNILVALDFSDVSAEVVALTAELATDCSSRVWLLHVAPPTPEFAGRQLQPTEHVSDVPPELAEQHKQLAEMEADLTARGIDAKAILARGDTVETLLGEAHRIGADLIIMGSHGHGALYRAVVGSVSAGVLRSAQCPLMLVPANRKRD